MARLVIAIVTTLIWEAMLVAIWRWGLPLLGIKLPLFVLIVAMAILATYAIVSFQLGTRALGRKAVVGLPAMVGARGRVVSPLAPEGMVRINGELWGAKAANGNIGRGERITVVGQDGFKLTVRKGDGGGVRQE